MWSVCQHSNILCNQNITMRRLTSILVVINNACLKPNRLHGFTRTFHRTTVKSFDLKSTRDFSTSQSNRRILQSLYPEITIPNVLLPEYMYQNIEKFPDQIATECALTKKTYTFREFAEKSKAFAANLRTKLGLQDRDVVHIIMPNHPEYPIITLGIIQAKCICSPLNPVYTVSEFERLIEESNAKCVVTTKTLYPTVKAAIDNLKKKLHIIVCNPEGDVTPNGTLEATDLMNPQTDISVLSELTPASENDIIFLPFSSGTTGLPKGVELTHKNIVSNLVQIICMRDIMHQATMLQQEQDIVPGILPFFHIYGLVVILLDKLQIGCKIVTMPRFTANDFITMIKDYKPTVLFIVPPIALLMSYNEGVTVNDLKSVRFVMSGAAPLGVADVHKLQEKLPPSAKIFQGYGLTETSPVVTVYHKYSQNYHAGSVGSLLPNTEAKIVCTQTGESLGVNQTGELVIRGPQVMKGYYNNEKATKDVISADRWFQTGDIAYYDENEQFFITDRLKELIKVKGFQVAPAELEAVIRSHPDIVDAGVIGVPHPINGEAPRAFVVLGSGKSLTEKQVQAFVQERVASFKKITGGIKFVETIPKSAAGKILRRELRNL